MSIPRFRVIVPSALVVVLFGGTVSAQSQPPAGSRRERPAQACSMSQRMLTARVVDRGTGEPVVGATVVATRVRTRKVVNSTTTMGTPGDYYIVEDGGIPDLEPKGEPMRIVATKGRRRASVTVLIGLDARGCHIEWKDGVPTVRL
jgi:hypothetical protein